MSSYWNDTLKRQVSRRRALAATGSASMAAALLAACGGGGGSGGPAASGLLTFPQDTTSQAKVGGTFRSTMSEPPSIDPIGSAFNPGITVTANYAYPRLLKWKVVKSPASHAGEHEGDFAESYELSPDKMSMTFKLRPGLKWDLPSGREIDASDVLFSYNRTVDVSRFGANLANRLSPDAPIESITAPDSRTLLMKFAFPDPSIYSLLASYNLMLVMPKESDMPAAQGGFDPRGEIRGYGPWQFVEWKPSQGLVYKRNPNYYVKGRPFFDRVELFIIPETATRLAQFRAGQFLTTGIPVTDVLPMKRELPDLLLRQADGYPTNNPTLAGFGYEGDSPFKDKRVRQAAVMLIDLDASEDALNNSNMFKAEGIDLAIKQNTIMSPNYVGYYLDPQDEKAFGANVKYLQYNITEAKRLLSAAGFPNGFKTTFVTGSANTQSDIVVEQLKAGGIEAAYDFPPNSAETNRRLTRAYAAGQNNGSNGIYQKSAADYADIRIFLSITYLAGGGSFIGMTTDGRSPEKGDPEIEAIVKKIKPEFDNQKARDLAHELQRTMAEKAYSLTQSRRGLGLSLSWPAYGNFGLWRTSTLAPASGTETLIHTWLDETKAPFKKA